MAIKSKEEILEQLNVQIGEDNSDDALALIEDLNDTLNDYETRTADSTNWKEKYEQNDKEWREKYRNTFFSGVEQKEDPKEYEEKEVPKTFDDLFTAKED